MLPLSDLYKAKTARWIVVHLLWKHRPLRADVWEILRAIHRTHTITTPLWTGTMACLRLAPKHPPATPVLRHNGIGQHHQRWLILPIRCLLRIHRTCKSTFRRIVVQQPHEIVWPVRALAAPATAPARTHPDPQLGLPAHITVGPQPQFPLFTHLHSNVRESVDRHNEGSPGALCPFSNYGSRTFDAHEELEYRDAHEGLAYSTLGWSEDT